MTLTSSTAVNSQWTTEFFPSPENSHGVYLLSLKMLVPPKPPLTATCTSLGRPPRCEACLLFWGCFGMHPGPPSRLLQCPYLGERYPKWVQVNGLLHLSAEGTKPGCSPILGWAPPWTWLAWILEVWSKADEKRGIFPF